LGPSFDLKPLMRSFRFAAIQAKIQRQLPGRDGRSAGTPYDKSSAMLRSFAQDRFLCSANDRFEVTSMPEVDPLQCHAPDLRCLAYGLKQSSRPRRTTGQTSRTAETLNWAVIREPPLHRGVKGSPFGLSTNACR
jgi:hypothetical protein